MTSHRGNNDVKAIFGKAMNAVYQNKQRPQEAVASAVPAINTELAERAKDPDQSA